MLARIPSKGRGRQFYTYQNMTGRNETVMKNQEHSYADNSDIHGIHHLSSSNTAGKDFWIAILAIGFTCVSYQVYELVNYNQDPIVTNIGIVYPEEGVEIPNITVCSYENEQFQTPTALSQHE